MLWEFLTALLFGGSTFWAVVVWIFEGLLQSGCFDVGG